MAHMIDSSNSRCRDGSLIMKTYYVGNTGFGPVAIWFRVDWNRGWWVSHADPNQSRYMITDDFGSLV